nr:hypothetical protein [Halorubrum vacuolatum]
MIVVATADFELYHEAVRELRERGLRITTMEPAEIGPNGGGLPAETTVVIATADDRVDLGARGEVSFVAADPSDPRAAIDEALATLRGDEGRTVVEIDPGPQPGIAVLVDDVVIAAFQVPLPEVSAVVAEEVADAADPLVRVGDGDRLKGTRIIADLEDVGGRDGALTVELVDETGTTPYLGRGARGASDLLAAVNVARIEGERVERREIDPTEGEIRRIQDESRRRSNGELTVGEPLARRVAAGELTVEEAVAVKRGDGESDR